MFRPLLLAATCAALLALLAETAFSRAVADSPQLWATVNVCDTPRNPDVIGIRASMPGGGRRDTLWMRFEVQYRSPADGQWHAIAQRADSGWQRLGASVNRRIESGWNFKFESPETGEHVLRGVATFRWTRDGRTVRRLREVTEGGHRSTRGADPPGYSAATCRIR